jgi:hypothetical protein
MVVAEGDKVKIMQGSKTVINTASGSNLNLNLNCPNGHRNKLNLGGNDMVMPNKDKTAQNEARRRALQVQIDSLTAVKANMQKQVDSMTARIATIQAQLNAIPVTPTPAPTPVVKPAVK